jgi:hypothetical protein
MASQELPYSFKMLSNNTELLIEYIDEKFNTYKCLIDCNDTIISTFLQGDMIRLKNMLETNPQFEIKINDCVLTIYNPIFIQYSLQLVQHNKSSDSDKINMLINEINKLKKKNEQLHQHIMNEHEQIKTELKNQSNNIVNNCVIFGSFNPGLKPNTTPLFNIHCKNINLKYINDPYSMGAFDLSPLKMLNDLLVLNLEIHQKPFIENKDEHIYKPISYCKQLKQFALSNHMLHGDKMKHVLSDPKLNIEDHQINLFDLNFLQQLNNLIDIKIHYVYELHDINIIYELPELKNIQFYNCYKIQELKPNFKKNLHVSMNGTCVEAK